MHPCLGNWMTIVREVVYYTRAACAFSARPELNVGTVFSIVTVCLGKIRSFELSRV